MPRFFLPGRQLENNLILDGEEAHHLAFSLRAKVGETVVLPDGEGNDHVYCITGFTHDCVELARKEIRPGLGEPEVQVTLFLACAKGDKIEQMIQKSVECGCVHIVPFLSQNCISRPEKGKKTERWNKVALEASKQCGRSVVPVVEEVCSFTEAVTRAAQIGGAILYEHATMPTSVFLNQFVKAGKKELAFIIGSEGGFTPGEVDKAEKAGMASLSLGKRILRCETVPSFLMGVVLCATGEL